MEQCATCKWWVPRPDKIYGMCDLITKGGFTTRIETKAKIYLEGQDVEKIEFLTDADFGCVQHEPREDA